MYWYNKCTTNEDGKGFTEKTTIKWNDPSNAKSKHTRHMNVTCNEYGVSILVTQCTSVGPGSLHDFQCNKRIGSAFPPPRFRAIDLDAICCSHAIATDDTFIQRQLFISVFWPCCEHDVNSIKGDFLYSSFREFKIYIFSEKNGIKCCWRKHLELR